MNIAVLVLLIILVFFFVETQNIFGAFIVSLLIIVDLIGGIVSKILTGIWRFIMGLFGVASAEFTEMENAKPNPPSGKKMFEKGFSDIGKSIGKGVKAQKEGKKIEDPYEKKEFFAFTGKMAGDILDGIKGLFK